MMLTNLTAHSHQHSCPECAIGRVSITMKPFIKLYKNHMFTIPYALGYECDLCDYYSVDDIVTRLMSRLIDAADKPQNAAVIISALKSGT